MMQQWGRFTVRGSDDFEESMSSLFTNIQQEAEGILTPDVCRALILLGGYGRGEGGVVVSSEGERPHNNLDFLVITTNLSASAQNDLKARVEERLSPLADDYGIEFDLAIISEARLRRSPCLVMWYDMRFGHKTVVGDADLVPSLKQFSLDRIPDWDILNLLVNRGTLILINDQIIATRELTGEDRERIVKHAMKAIIGYGDALLYFLGQYDWSYAEKQRRLRECTDISADFRALYDEAIEFRFQPDYEAYKNCDLAVWMDELRAVLAPIHLECERKRLNREDLSWSTYTENVFSRAILDDSQSPRSWAKKAVNLVRTTDSISGKYSASARVGYRMLGTRGVLPAMFPVAAYGIEDERFRKLAVDCLHAQGESINELRRAYLLKWGTSVEPPFLELAKKWGLDLRTETSTGVSA